MSRATAHAVHMCRMRGHLSPVDNDARQAHCATEHGRNEPATQHEALPIIAPWVQVLLSKVIGPYTCVRLEFLAAKVNCGAAEAERLVAALINDGRIEVRLITA